MSHEYSIQVAWTGNTGSGTSDYRAYQRSHIIRANGKAEIECSSDSHFRGDANKYNPEELLVASLSTCHMLQYLHLCADAGVIITFYEDNARGKITLTANGGGYFTEVTLAPKVMVTRADMVKKAQELHIKANELCFIAKSVNFPVHHNPACSVEG